MGKKEKAQAVPVGRVPLVQDGKPLLYPRYTSIEELLQIGKGEKHGKEDAIGTKGVERPSKKQKRAAAGGPATVGEPTSGQPTSDSADKGYGVIGEDGLTYKQRRQLRRAAERAAKAQAEAEAAVGAATTPAEAAASADAAPQAPSAAAAAAPSNGAEPGDARAKKAKEKKKDKRGRDEQEAAPAAAAAVAAATAAAAPAAKGNADEAARMRAVLGFTAAPGHGGGGSGALSLAALAATAGPAAAGSAAASGAGPANADDSEAGGEGDLDGRSAKKQKKEKKDKARKEKDMKKENGHGGEEAAPAPTAAASAAAAAEEEEEGGAGAARAKAVGAGAGASSGATVDTAAPNTGAKAAAVASGKRHSTGKGSQPFSFEFQLQEAVEAETQARLARLMALDSTKDGFVPRRVWVSGLPHEYDEDTIREYWGYCGEVESMHQLTFQDSGNFNGTAFITFKTQEGYEAALACNGEMLEGRALRVEKCKAAAEIKGKARTMGGGATANGVSGGKSPTQADGKGGRVTGYPVAYCGNLAFEAGVDELQQLFVAAGVIPAKIRLHTDKASGRSKGYAHVHFSSDEDVDKAVALDGTSFHGRKIRVSHAQPKPGETA